MLLGLFMLVCFISYTSIAILCAEKFSRKEEQFWFIFLMFFIGWFVLPAYLIFKFWEFTFNSIIFRK